MANCAGKKSNNEVLYIEKPLSIIFTISLLSFHICSFNKNSKIYKIKSLISDVSLSPMNLEWIQHIQTYKKYNDKLISPLLLRTNVLPTRSLSLTLSFSVSTSFVVVRFIAMFLLYHEQFAATNDMILLYGEAQAALPEVNRW